MIIDWEDFSTEKESGGSGEQSESAVREKERLFRNTNATIDACEKPVVTLGGMVLERSKSPSPDVSDTEEPRDQRYFYMDNEHSWDVVPTKDADPERPTKRVRYFGIPPYRRSTLAITKTPLQQRVLEWFPPETGFRAEKVLQRRDKKDENGYEYLVKWRGRSLRDSTWVSGDELPRNMIKYQKRLDSNIVAFKKQGLSDPEAVAAKLVASYNEHFLCIPEETIFTVGSSLSLVKWKDSPYNEATWEQGCVVLPEQQQQKAQKLRYYQKEGVSWILSHLSTKRSCVFGDEEGLGRRIQTVIALDKLRKAHYEHPFLVIAPDSNLNAWKEACARWTTMRCFKLGKRKKDRAVVSEIIMRSPFYERGEESEYDILVISQDAFHAEYDHVKSVPWSCVVVEDQALRMKSVVLEAGFGCLLVLANGDSGKEWAESLPKDLQNTKDEKAEILERTAASLIEGFEKCPKEERVVLVEQTSAQRNAIRAIYDAALGCLSKDDKSAYVDTAAKIFKCCNCSSIEPFTDAVGKVSYLNEFVSKQLGKAQDKKLLILATSTDVLEMLSKHFNSIGISTMDFSANARLSVEDAKTTKVFLADKLHTRARKPPDDVLEQIGIAVIYDTDINPISDIIKLREYYPEKSENPQPEVYRLVTKGTCEQYAIAMMSGQEVFSFDTLKKMYP